jgi:hypothetical protein
MFCGLPVPWVSAKSGHSITSSESESRIAGMSVISAHWGLEDHGEYLLVLIGATPETCASKVN